LLDRFPNLASLPPTLAAALGAILGLAVGSYLATVLLRWPEGESANQGRSRCDNCKRQLLWYELAPLVSYVAARGRCRTCSGAISPVSPLMEAACGLAGALLFGLGAPAAAPMVWLLICLALFDILFLWLPNRLVLLLALFCLLVPLPDAADVGMRLAGGLLGFGLLWLVGEGFRLATGKVGLGRGDPKLFGAIGLWCGALQLPVILLVACGIGFADAGVKSLRGQTIRGLRMPLGAYLCASAMIAALLQAMAPDIRPFIYG
jgi:leader peptidase (prepilin peptidase)/N-methyltransferase